MAQYEAALEAQPLLTKSVTSGVLYGVGDWVAQTVEQRRADGNEPPKPFDGARWTRAVVFGGIFYPGVAHLHYNFLENLVVARWAIAPSRVPFASGGGGAAVRIHAAGRRVPSWGTDPLFAKSAAVPPRSPLACSSAGSQGSVECGPIESLTLVPFGATRLRVAMFPWAES